MSFSEDCPLKEYKKEFPWMQLVAFGIRAYRAFSRWADALKGPTELFIFYSFLNSSPAIFWPSQVKCVHRGFHGPMQINLDLNSKRHDIVGPEVLFLSKTTRCNDTYLHDQSKSFWTVRFTFFFFLFCSPSLHLFDPKYSKSSNIVKKKKYYLK